MTKEHVSKCCGYYVHICRKKENGYMGFCGKCGKKLLKNEIRIHKKKEYEPLLIRLIENDRLIEEKLCHLFSVIESNKGDKAVEDALQEEISQYRKAKSLLISVSEEKEG